MDSIENPEPVQIDPDTAGRLQIYVPCPVCGGYVEDDSVWLRYQRFYCSEECARKGKEPVDPYDVELMALWRKAIEMRGKEKREG